MSDPILEEEDDLISQDDIDKLLDISSEDDDTDELAQNDIDSLINGSGQDVDTSGTGEKDAGELSQDDIDSLMTDDDPDDDAGPEADDAGELSQDDIDSLLNGPDQDMDASGTEEEDTGELSQDDIDSLMTDDALDDDDETLSQDSGAGDDDDDELISLEDIQGAMDGDTQGDDASDSIPEPEPQPAAEPEPEPEILEAESNQDNVAEQRVEDETVDDAAIMDESSREEDPFDVPIDEDQAADVADCMLTQEDMDALIEAGLPAPDVTEGDARDNGEDSLPEEIDLTSATDGDGVDDAVQENDDDVTQEDIDALLQQSDEEDEFLDADEDILISQDDINTLLMAADQEDEDVLGDIDGEDDAYTDLEAQSDALESDSDQVVLEGIENAEISDGKESALTGLSKKGEKIKALLKSKAVLAAASVLLFMGISVPLSYFLFFSSAPAPLPERQTASLTEIDFIRDGQANISADTPALPPSRRPGTILLTDFIILASDQSRTMTYVYADVSIDYSDQRAYDEINSNLAFYRDLIYGAIQTRLVSEKNNEVTEADLLWGVEASLKKVLPPQYIDKISFKSFKAT
ncbi:hypothetical protein [Desulfobacter curvatus]|uniref:hypothetical protein n=1 Tax=Desulfobacter curvatus TaxID=2290 RepID=UPI0003752D15|nr:hypothetical protein [Desulfobacter curvatus]